MEARHRFSLDLSWGEWAAKYISSFFKTCAVKHIYFNNGGNVLQVMQFHAKVDLILEYKDGRQELVEVKSCRFQEHRLTEFFIEVFSCTNDNNVTPGWLYTTKADKLVYAIQQSIKNQFDVYMVDWVRMKTCVFENAIGLPPRTAMPSSFSDADFPLRPSSWRWWTVGSPGNPNHTASIRIRIKDANERGLIVDSGRCFDGLFIRESPERLLYARKPLLPVDNLF